MGLVLLLLLAAAYPVTFGPGGRFQLERSGDSFGIRSHGIIEQLGPSRTKLYPLPQSTAEEYMRLRPRDYETNTFAPQRYERQEVIGPNQFEDGKLWFGKQFYDSEGYRGVGAFGYFDTSTRAYTLFSPPEVAPYEISAVFVDPDSLWLALDKFGEDISRAPRGLVRWDRKTHEVRQYALEFEIVEIRPQGDSLRLQTRGGYALLRDGVLRRFLTNGKPIGKFLPPPTKN